MVLFSVYGLFNTGAFDNLMFLNVFLVIVLKIKRFLAFLVILPCLLRGFLAVAADMPEYVAPPAPETHAMIHLPPGKSRMLHAGAAVARVAVDDPALIGVFVENPSTLYIIARGGTGIAHFTAFGRDGGVVMARRVLVTGDAQRYIRVRVAGEASVYYCAADQCYRTQVVAPK
jgi:hypothetical protein